jgi:hypothetical protein
MDINSFSNLYSDSAIDNGVSLIAGSIAEAMPNALFGRRIEGGSPHAAHIRTISSAADALARAICEITKEPYDPSMRSIVVEKAFIALLPQNL